MTVQDLQLTGAPYAALTHLLTALRQIADEHTELYDTYLRETMATVLSRGFVCAEPDFTLPDSFGMYTDEADNEVRRAFEVFFQHLAVEDESWRQLNQTERLLILGSDTIQNSAGQSMSDFIGFYLHPEHVVNN